MWRRRLQMKKDINLEQRCEHVISPKVKGWWLKKEYICGAKTGTKCVDYKDKYECQVYRDDNYYDVGI